MKKEPKHTKEEYLGMLAVGMDRKDICKKWDISLAGLFIWLLKWGIKDPAVEEIALAEFQHGRKLAAPAASVVDEQPADTESSNEPELGLPAPPADFTADVLEELKLEIERLKAANVEVVALAGKTTEQLTIQLSALHETLEPAQAEIERLRAEIDGLRSIRATEKQDHIETEQRLQATIEKLEERLAEAVESLLLTGEPDEDAPADMVNHPSHYTAGSIECIDAIEAATTELTGGEAYNTGAAIKYLWRWKRKGGKQDLKKATWYINRLIGEGEAEA